MSEEWKLMMDKQGRSLADTVWTRLDRKAGAITELTIRQLRHRLSTWVVLGVGTLLLLTLLAMCISLELGKAGTQSTMMVTLTIGIWMDIQPVRK